MIKKRKLFLFESVHIMYDVDRVATFLLALIRILVALIPSFQTIVVAEFINEVIYLHHNNMYYSSKLNFLILSMVILLAISWIAKSLVNLLAEHAKIRLRVLYKPRIIKKVTELKYEVMENGDSRDLILRVVKDVDTKICSAYMDMLGLVELLLKVGGILVIMFTQVWWVAIVLFIISIPCFYVSIKSGSEEYEAETKVTRINRVNEYYNVMLKDRDYVAERTIFGYGHEFGKKFYKQYDETRKLKNKVKIKWYIRMKMGSMATVIVSAVLIAVMVPLALQESISVGMFMAMTNAVFNIVQNMSWDLAWAVDCNAKSNEYFKELDIFYSMEEDTTLFKTKRILSQFETLEFIDVSFKYPGTDTYVLKNVSFKIEKGKKYAFVGINGSGKTTIVKLLLGLYENYTGKILVNGEDIDKYDRKFISVVFQDFAKYPITVADNIKLGRYDKNLTEEELNIAMKRIDLDKTVRELKWGINTVLGKRKSESVDISGGEWQKLALARCFVSKAFVKILDEPTAAMDPLYEKMLYSRFREISVNDTVLMISHRLGSIKEADCIFVLDGGQIAEKGTHEELMEYGNLYTRMYESQAKWYKASRNEGFAYEK